MIKILVCVNDGLLKLRIKRVLSEKNYSYKITEQPIKRDDLLLYNVVIIHSSYYLTNLHNFIENAVINKVTTFMYITSNVVANPFRKFKEHSNLILIDENKMDIELPISIRLYEKYSDQITSLNKENVVLTNKLQEANILSKCKRKLISQGLSENDAHKYILKYSMDNHIDKIEACNRLLANNSE